MIGLCLIATIVIPSLAPLLIEGIIFGSILIRIFSALFALISAYFFMILINFWIVSFPFGVGLIVAAASLLLFSLPLGIAVGVVAARERRRMRRKSPQDGIGSA
jgi:hypothetical protein